MSRQRVFREGRGTERTQVPGVLQRNYVPFPPETVGFNGKKPQASLPKAEAWSARRPWRGKGYPVHLSPGGPGGMQRPGLKGAEGQEGEVPWQQFAGTGNIKKHTPPRSVTCTLGKALGRGGVLRPDLTSFMFLLPLKNRVWEQKFC